MFCRNKSLGAIICDTIGREFASEPGIPGFNPVEYWLFYLFIYFWKDKNTDKEAANGPVKKSKYLPGAGLAKTAVRQRTNSRRSFILRRNSGMIFQIIIYADDKLIDRICQCVRS